MKIRVTITAENNKPRPEELTENMVISAWQVVLSAVCLGSDDKVIVERVEFVEDGDANV